jgi:esterase/lipase superfamily enzyme
MVRSDRATERLIDAILPVKRMNGRLFALFAVTIHRRSLIDTNPIPTAFVPTAWSRPLPMALLSLVILVGGCATPARSLMPTPTLYLAPAGEPVFASTHPSPDSPDLEVLYITDRAPPSAEEVAESLPYGQERARRIAFGTVRVRVTPDLDWASLSAQSHLAQRTREVNLELGEVQELGAFPEEPYQLIPAGGRRLLRDRAQLEIHEAAKQSLRGEVQRRLATAPKREILLYVHGFNETFESAAYTTADLCHFLGREHVCAFFTWPAASSGNFLTAYTATTESGDFAVEHLKKSIRLLSTTPGVDGMHILAHSRGTAVALKAVRELALETIAAGKEPAHYYRIKNLVLLSPDIDVDIAAQQITGFLSDPDLVTVWPEGRLPRVLDGRLTVYTSPKDRALLVSRILFRSRDRVGQLRAEDIPEPKQRYLAQLGSLALITYQGKRTDLFGHSYFTSNPRVSSDLIQLIRHGKALGQPGREPVQTGPITWVFPDQPHDASGSTTVPTINLKR